MKEKGLDELVVVIATVDYSDGDLRFDCRLVKGLDERILAAIFAAPSRETRAGRSALGDWR